MKFKFIIIFLTTALFYSCETDDNPNIAILESDLIGTWNLKQQTLEDGIISYTDANQSLTATYSAYAKDINMTMSFLKNPNKLSANGNYTLVATANFSGQTQTEEELVAYTNDPNLNTSWALNNNTITLTNNDEFPTNLIIESYNGTTLILKAEINETETDNGQTISIKAKIYFILEK